MEALLTDGHILALDTYTIDYDMTRDNSLQLGDDFIHRFSCKNTSLSEDLKDRHVYTFTKPRLQPYQAGILGQVHETKAVFNHRVDNSAELLNCYVLTLKCPTAVKESGRLFFSQQIAALESIMQRDNAQWDEVHSANLLVESWIGPTVNDMKTIKVVLTEDAMCLWNGGDWAFEPDQHMKLTDLKQVAELFNDMLNAVHTILEDPQRRAVVQYGVESPPFSVAVCLVPLPYSSGTLFSPTAPPPASSTSNATFNEKPTRRTKHFGAPMCVHIPRWRSWWSGPWRGAAPDVGPEKERADAREYSNVGYHGAVGLQGPTVCVNARGTRGHERKSPRPLAILNTESAVGGGAGADFIVREDLSSDPSSNSSTCAPLRRGRLARRSETE
ncbi:hypothetical protein B0H13DRAFT_2659867 [Mycena leptocephala]|nr:hypothetical protein B0H13DRAFT_2659867 [Mycena leptocephala]